MHSITIDKKKNELVVRIPLLKTPEVSRSGKFQMIARTDNFVKGDATYQGKIVAVSLCAGVSAR